MELLIATTEGVETVGGARALEGRDVVALAVAGADVWAVVDGGELWRRPREWERVATWDGPSLTCVAAAPGSVVAGTAEAHLVRLQGSRLVPVTSFDELPERSKWYTPWGGPPDTRSVAVIDRTTVVNIHVGGVARDAGDGWRALVDIDVDVHQVQIAPDGSLLVATGAAGFGRSIDDGDTWSWDDQGLHGAYCRAVAVAGDHVLLSASTGPSRTRGALYRRPLGAAGPWERVSDLVEGNIDTFWVAGAGGSSGEAAFVTPDGEVRTSSDAGASWELAGRVGGRPRAVALVA